MKLKFDVEEFTCGQLFHAKFLSNQCSDGVRGPQNCQIHKFREHNLTKFSRIFYDAFTFFVWFDGLNSCISYRVLPRGCVFI